MPRPDQLCTCEVHGCAQITTSDRETGNHAIGRYLKPNQYDTHQRDQRAKDLCMRRTGKDGLVEISHRLMGATLSYRELSDATITWGVSLNAETHSSQPPRASNRHSGSSTILPMPVPLPPRNSNLPRCLIQQYRAEFMEAKLCFALACVNLTFGQSPLAPDTAAPRLEYTSRRGSDNMAFLHQETLIQRLISATEAVHADPGDPSLSQEQYQLEWDALLTDLRRYCTSLQATVQQQWLERKLEHSFGSLKVEESAVIDTCIVMS